VTILKRAALFLGLPIILVAVWWFTSANSTNFFLPPLSKILAVLPETWNLQRLGHDVVPSLTRFSIGYGIALVVGIVGGVAIGSSRLLRALLEPMLEFLRAIPPPVLVPLFILIAGIDNLSKVLLIVSGCVWPVLLNTVEGVRAVDSVLADTCRSYGVRGPLRLRTLVLRSASPQIMVGARQALAIGLILTVISEMKAAYNGIGFMIQEFQRGFQIPEMWSGVLVLGLIGVLLALLFRLVERRVLLWYHGVRAAERGAR
jgi:ABC-type nitrate/sulfonate/bicarbonate transport system permease component